MKDVAALAGVGLSTVSRVVGGHPGVKADKVARVQAAIRELRFTRNDSARNLRTGNAATIGVVVTRLSDPFYAQLAHAVEERAQADGMLALIASSSDDPRDAEAVLRRVTRRRLDGLVVVVPEGADVTFLQSEIDGGTPVVLVDRPAAGVDADHVVVDNVQGMKSAVDHLVNAGHERIACILHTTGQYTADARLQGYRLGLAENGLRFDDDIVARVIEDAPAVAQVLASMLGAPHPPTAVITTNSPMTKVALRAFALVKTWLPIVGFDDLEDADLFAHPVTTVAQDPIAMGQQAAELLIERITNPQSARRRVVLGTQIVPR